MSPVAILLNPSGRFPRELSLSLSRHGYITAIVWVHFGQLDSQMLAYASEPQERCRVTADISGSASVWIGGAAFDVTEEEAVTIAERLGLELQREKAIEPAPTVSA